MIRHRTFGVALLVALLAPLPIAAQAEAAVPAEFATGAWEELTIEAPRGTSRVEVDVESSGIDARAFRVRADGQDASVRSTVFGATTAAPGGVKELELQFTRPAASLDLSLTYVSASGVTLGESTYQVRVLPGSENPPEPSTPPVPTTPAPEVEPAPSNPEKPVEQPVVNPTPSASNADTGRGPQLRPAAPQVVAAPAPVAAPAVVERPSLLDQLPRTGVAVGASALAALALVGGGVLLRRLSRRSN